MTNHLSCSSMHSNILKKGIIQNKTSRSIWVFLNETYKHSSEMRLQYENLSFTLTLQSEGPLLLLNTHNRTKTPRCNRTENLAHWGSEWFKLNQTTFIFKVLLLLKVIKGFLQLSKMCENILFLPFWGAPRYSIRTPSLAFLLWCPMNVSATFEIVFVYSGWQWMTLRPLDLRTKKLISAQTSKTQDLYSSCDPQQGEWTGLWGHIQVIKLVTRCLRL